MLSILSHLLSVHLYTAYISITRTKQQLSVCFLSSRLNFCIPFVAKGELTLEEFIEGARGHPDIMEMLKEMMDLTPVLEIIVEGRQKRDNCEEGQQQNSSPALSQAH